MDIQPLGQDLIRKGGECEVFQPPNRHRSFPGQHTFTSPLDLIVRWHHQVAGDDIGDLRRRQCPAHYAAEPQPRIREVTVSPQPAAELDSEVKTRFKLRQDPGDRLRMPNVTAFSAEPAGPSGPLEEQKVKTYLGIVIDGRL